MNLRLKILITALSVLLAHTTYVFGDSSRPIKFLLDEDLEVYGLRTKRAKQLARASLYAYRKNTLEPEGLTQWETFQQHGLLADIWVSESEAILSIRGTKELQNWLHNLNWAMRNHSLGRVHSGYQLAAARIFDWASLHLKTLAKQGKSLSITGHSLGGSVANLLLADLVTQDPATIKKVNSVSTFGSPAVGDVDFVENVIAESKKLNPLIEHIAFVLPGDSIAYLSKGRYGLTGMGDFLILGSQKAKFINHRDFIESSSLSEFTAFREKMPLGNHAMKLYLNTLEDYPDIKSLTKSEHLNKANLNIQKTISNACSGLAGQIQGFFRRRSP